MSKNGRPTKFTPELGAAICKIVRAGVPVGVAAARKRIAKTTLYDWRKRGEQGEEPFAAFAADIEAAQAECEEKITYNVIAASKEDWKAGAFYLKCRHPEIYGDKIEVTQQVRRGVEEMFDAFRPHMSDPAYLEMLHAFEKVMGVEGLAQRSAGAGDESEERH